MQKYVGIRVVYDVQQIKRKQNIFTWHNFCGFFGGGQKNKSIYFSPVDWPIDVESVALALFSFQSYWPLTMDYHRSIPICGLVCDASFRFVCVILLSYVRSNGASVFCITQRVKDFYLV